jgi:hypothetical protein
MLKSPLREEPREQKAAVIRSKHESSLLDWLESSGRLIARDIQEPEFPEEEEISGLIDVDDVTYDDIDDDDDALDLEE